MVLKGSITSGKDVLTLAWPAKSLASGDSLTITGAGTNGGNLITKITLIEQGGRAVRLAENAVTTVTSATVQPTTSVGSIIGYDDIQDDGSGILKMAELQGNLVVYRDTAIYLMEYTGSTTSPFNVTKLKIPGGKSLYYRHTLVDINGREHVYAGRSSFYEFDLSSRIPREIPAADAVSNNFYDTAKVEDTEKIFSVHNTPTQEVWVFGTGATDKVLCYDYRYGTFSTTNVPVTAAASVKKPEVSLVTEESEDWFIMGDATGVVYTYGKVDNSLKWGDAATTGKSIYYRRGDADKSAYESLMKFGLTNFGNNLDEKDLRGYVLHLSSKTVGNPEVTVNIYGTRNEAEAPTLLGSKTLDNAETKSLIPCYFRQHLFQDEIKASGLIDVQFSGRTFDAARIDTESLIRTNVMPAADLTFRKDLTVALSSTQVDSNFEVLRDFSNGLETLYNTSFNQDGTLKNSLTAVNLKADAVYYAADTGTTDEYAITLTPAITEYSDGMTVAFKANTANDGEATLNVNAVGAKPLTKRKDVPLATGDITSGQIVEARYDSALGGFQVVSQLANQVGLPLGTTGQHVRVNNLIMLLSSTLPR